jgi:hypothetical protein
MQNPGSDAGVFVWGDQRYTSLFQVRWNLRSNFPIVVMDSGLGALRRPGMTNRMKIPARHSGARLLARARNDE